MKNVIRFLLIRLNHYFYGFINLHVRKTIKMDIGYLSGDYGNCGIICAAMCIKYFGGDIVLDEKFLDSQKNQSTYIENIGWKHAGLKIIIEKYSTASAKIFRFKSLNYVLNCLNNNSPVIVSILAPSPTNLSQENVYESADKKMGLEKHMVLCVGYDEKNIILHDPRGIGIYSKNLKLPKSVFEKIFLGNGITVTSQ
ncbi:C39 family peptidase [Candidatus Dojkabacteria bacterium]|nr:C39 family peptidase [Candidatus Dojkabacteria bacterium]